MDERTFEFCQHLNSIYYVSGVQREELLPESLYYALGHEEEECRLIGLSLLDHFLGLLVQDPNDSFVNHYFELVPSQFRNEIYETSVHRFMSSSRWTDFRVLPRALKGPEPSDAESKWLAIDDQSKHENILLVHGTWAKGGWWAPHSPFANYIDTLNWGEVYKQNDYFQWTGKNSDYYRRQAGANLANWLDRHPHVDTVIAHSHGGNVTLLASRLLQNTTSKRSLTRVVLLGTPSRTDYTPELRRINLLRNIYSFGDLWQTPGGTAPHARGEGRTASDSNQTLNVLVKNGVFGPSHSDLHTEPVWRNNNLELMFS